MLILLAAVVILLPLLAFLQYRWLGQVSEAERERMRAVLLSAASQFSETFDREITRAYSIFQHDQRDKVSRLAEEYARRFQEWEASAAQPRIVREILVILADAEGETRMMRFDQATEQFEAIAWPNEFAALRQPVSRIVTESILEGLAALVVPPEDWAEDGGKKEGAAVPHVLYTIVRLDLENIQKLFLPALASRYFAAKKGLQYDLAVVSRDDPQKVIFQTRRDRPATAPASDAVAGLFDVRLETLPGRIGSPDRKGLFRVVKRQRLGAGTEELAGYWKLLVWHQGGSLEEAVARGRRRNLAISFGVLLLLAMSVGLIVASSRRATRLAQEQMKFVAGVTHELRTPLAVICSAGENLADGVVSQRDQIEKYGGLIRNEGRRLSQMVEQVLAYAGAESGQQTYRLQPVEVRNVIDAAVRACRQPLEEGGFEIEMEIEPGLPQVNGDAPALQRALQNLLGNAIKYGGESRPIALRARKHAGEVWLTVEDHGWGIAAVDLPHVFEPFFRAPEVVAAQIKGSGLGLSLVQHILIAHGGRVTVESAPGRGSSFTLQLPAIT